MSNLESRLMDESSEQSSSANKDLDTKPVSGITRRGLFGAGIAGLVGGLLGRRALDMEPPKAQADGTVKGLGTAPLGVMGERVALPNVGANTLYGGEAPTPTPTPTPKPTETPTPVDAFLANKSKVDSEGKIELYRGLDTSRAMDLNDLNRQKTAELTAKYATKNGFTSARIVTISTEERAKLKTELGLFDILQISKNPSGPQDGWYNVAYIKSRTRNGVREFLITIEPDLNTSDPYIQSTAYKSIARSYFAMVMNINGDLSASIIATDPEVIEYVKQSPLVAA